MKVYVDFEELDVEDRPTYICNKYNLQVKSINSGTSYDNVKLVSLADYTKQVRKEVVQEIKEKVKKLIDKDFKLCNHEYANGYCYGLQYDLAKILEQIQGEIK